MMNVRLIGSKDVHVNDISRSYRIRGRVARAIIKIYMITRDWGMVIIMHMVGNNVFCMKRIDVSTDIIMMFKYSDMKIKAKGVPAYSVLNPETSSLSPSAKSKGVRLVSASRHVTQM